MKGQSWKAGDWVVGIWLRRIMSYCSSLGKRSLDEKLPSLREIDNDGLKWGSEEGIGTAIERVE